MRIGKIFKLNSIWFFVHSGLFAYWNWKQFAWIIATTTKITELARGFSICRMGSGLLICTVQIYIIIKLLAGLWPIIIHICIQIVSDRIDWCLVDFGRCLAACSLSGWRLIPLILLYTVATDVFFYEPIGWVLPSIRRRAIDISNSFCCCCCSLLPRPNN